MDVENITSFLNRNKKILAVLIVGLFLFYYIPTFLSTVVPGPEGIRALNYGVQFGAGGDILKASQLDTLPTNFAWGSTQPSVMSLKHIDPHNTPYQFTIGLISIGPSWWYANGNGEVRSEVQRPTLQDDPIGIAKRTLTYYKYTKINDTQIEIRKVMVEIIPADFIIQLSIVPGKGIYTFKDIRLWYALDTVVWLNAYANSPPPDPSPLTNDTTTLISSSYRGAFPIISWVGKYQDWIFQDDQGNYRTSPPDDTAVSFVQLDPSLQGRFIDLYTSPANKYDLMLSSDIATNPELLEEALKPTWLPDPRFSQTVYFYINLNNFGAYVYNHPGNWIPYSDYTIYYPSVFYRLRVVYAVYGEWVYLWTAKTAEEVGYVSETWQYRTSSRETFLSPWTSWWDNLFAGLGGIGNFILMALFSVGFILIAIAVLLHFLGRRRKE